MEEGRWPPGVARMVKSEVMLTTLSNNKTSPKWTFSGRYSGVQRPTTPGPGSYGRNEVAGSKQRCPAWGFGTSTREVGRAASAPGPGQYDSISKTNRQAPNYGFGSAPRSRSAVGTTPGPGSYAPDFNATRHDAPKYTATPRRSGHANANSRPSTPGPGAYSSRREFSATAPEWGFGTAERSRLGPNPYPGPGSYNESSMVGDAPKYSMRGKTEYHGGFDREQPGPGQYGGHYTQFGY